MLQIYRAFLYILHEVDKKKDIYRVIGITHFKTYEEEEEVQDVLEETIASTFGLKSIDIEVTVIYFLFGKTILFFTLQQHAKNHNTKLIVLEVP
jgi:hypothetical protein